ncbi:uncharacterized protein LOC131674495 [Phymastichus coffea]|uniref:uncharacterized protein LOC131674495 n=1 Tax=Phymastichus coffea TaxID=108790 RepID=UPI00273B2EFA|nr:uncharacterized protein LOC131674495 [Phymastichus coffea]
MGTATGYALVALLASVCYVSAAVCTSVPDVITQSVQSVATPKGKVYVYKYFASVVAGQNEPDAFASKLQINARLVFKSQLNAAYLKFYDVQFNIYNGRDDSTAEGKFYPIEEAIEYFHQPVMVVYNEQHEVEGVKFQENDATWSRNMKKGLVSLFHPVHINNETFYHRFCYHQDTVYGKCNVDYLVYNNGEKDKILEQMYEPRNCSKFVLFDVTDSKNEDCNVPAEEDLVTAVKKVYTYGSIKDVADYVLKKVVSNEKFSYLPWSHNNYGVQFIETNQTIELEKVADESEYDLSATKFDDVKLSNLTFDKHEYIPNISSAEEIHLGRYQVDSKETLVPIVKKLLVDMVGFLKENQLDVEEKNPEQKYLLETLYRYLGYMDKESLRYLFDHFNIHSEKGNMTRKIFLRMLPHVGTQAVWKVVLDIIKDEQVYFKLDEETVIHILTNLPMFVLNPTEKFAKHVIEMKSLPDHVSYKVMRAGVLCYSILLHKVYKSVKDDEIPYALEAHLQYYYDRIKYENTYNNKILYMMAMRNVGVGIYKYLAPIIKGEDIFYVDVTIKKREKYRIAAMWAVAKSISQDYDKTYDLFWPILSNSSNPLSLRITAYELLVTRNPKLNMRILLNVHDLMENERDEHLFNYHYTTLKSNVESTNPCMQVHAKNMKKILRLTKPHKVLSSTLSTVNVHDYYDTVYGHGKIFKIAAEINEATGLPQTGYYEVISTYLRKPKLTTGYYWNIDGINFNSVMQITKNLLDSSVNIHMEITDEKVQTILRQTQGYKNFDKHIHVELWTMYNGYVTNVQVFFENGLTDYIRQLYNQYKPDADQLMDLKEKYNINVVDISFANHYKMVVVSGIGLPIMFYNDAPYMMYTKIKPDFFPQKNTLAMKVEVDSRFHRSSIYQMKFYNPFADITQSVQRHTVTAGALPIDVTFSLQMSAQSLKLELPRLAKRSSAAGLKIQTVDQVVILKDVFKNYLQTHCPTCQNITVITNGPTFKNNNLQVIQNLDSGMEFTYGMFDCEHNFEPNAEMQEWYRIFYSPKNNRKADFVFKLFMIVHQGMFNYVNNPYTSSCGLIMKVAPSTVHPVSYVEMNWRAGVLTIDKQTVLTLRGNVEVKSATTNDTIRNWEIDISSEVLQYVNAFKVKLTRKIPDEKNLKICFEAIKAYPKLNTNISNIEYKTVSKVSLVAGYTDDDNCVTDQVNIKAKIVGERLEEQIEHLKNYAKPGSCFKNASNPLDLDITKSFDWNCLYQIVKGTTMRKYSADVSYKQIFLEYYAKLQLFGDWVRSFWSSQITYRSEHTEEGHIQIHMAYPANKNYGNITVVSPHYTLEYIDVIYEQDNVEKRQNDLVFDNIAFPITFLGDFYKNDVRPCIAHAHELINDMNQMIPMEFRDWTLMSGDYGLMSYAVFVKTIADDKVAVRVYVLDHVLEVTPSESEPIITLNGEAIAYNNTIAVKNSIFDISTINKLIVVETKKTSKVKVYYTPYNVIVIPHITLDRSIDGICGHMGMTVYTQQVPLVYTST